MTIRFQRKVLQSLVRTGNRRSVFYCAPLLCWQCVPLVAMAPSVSCSASVRTVLLVTQWEAVATAPRDGWDKSVTSVSFPSPIHVLLSYPIYALNPYNIHALIPYHIHALLSYPTHALHLCVRTVLVMWIICVWFMSC